MTRIQHSVVIERPPAEVFDFVTTFENDKYWWKAVVHTEKLTPGPMDVGTEFTQESKVLGVISVFSKYRVLEYVRPDHVRYINESPQLPYSLLYRFTPTASGGTTFSLDAELEQKGILRVLSPLLMVSLKRQLTYFFGLLKQHLESRPKL